MLEKQDASIRSASLNLNATTADIVVLVERAILSSVVLVDGDDWTMGDLVKVDAEERVGVGRRFCGLHDSCPV